MIAAACGLALTGAPASAQSMTVLGGNPDARDCFEAARFEGVSMRDIAACDRALVPGATRRKDRIATYVNRGILKARNSDQAGAMADYESALKMAPRQAEVFVNRGNVRYATGDVAGALDDYARSLELDIRDQGAVHYNLGLAHEKLGQADAARRNYERALEIKPDWLLPRRRLEAMQTPADAGPGAGGR